MRQLLVVSQPTLYRTIHEAGALQFRIKGQRTPIHGLLRSIPRAQSRQPMYRVTETGRMERVATVNLPAGGQTVVELEGGGAQLFEGLPPAMIFSSPSGFLGRHVAQQVSRQHGLPAKLNLWSDDHRAAFLFTSEADAPGNLVFGDESLAAMLAQRKARTQADIIRSFAAFSELIGNDDTHFENLWLMLDSNGRPSAVAPAYDLLPMRYAPQVSGIGDPPLAPVSPSVGSIGVSGTVWQPAYRAARRFWKCAASDRRLSLPMRALAKANLAAIAEFIEPLVPAQRP